MAWELPWGEERKGFSLSCSATDHLSWPLWPWGASKGMFFSWPLSRHEQHLTMLWPCARDLMKKFQGDKWKLHGNQSCAAGVLCRQLLDFISFSFFSLFPGINSFKSLTPARLVWLSGKLKLAAGTFYVFLQNCKLFRVTNRSWGLSNDISWNLTYQHLGGLFIFLPEKLFIILAALSCK